MNFEFDKLANNPNLTMQNALSASYDFFSNGNNMQAITDPCFYDFEDGYQLNFDQFDDKIGRFEHNASDTHPCDLRYAMEAQFNASTKTQTNLINMDDLPKADGDMYSLYAMNLDLGADLKSHETLMGDKGSIAGKSDTPDSQNVTKPYTETATKMSDLGLTAGKAFAKPGAVSSKAKKSYPRWKKEDDIKMYSSLRRKCIQNDIQVEEFWSVRALSQELKDILSEVISENEWKGTFKGLFDRLKKLAANQTISVRQSKKLKRLCREMIAQNGKIDYNKLVDEFPGKTEQTLRTAWEASQ